MRLLVVLLAALLAPACVSGDTAGGRPRVVTGVYPMTYLAERIGGPDVEVVQVVPPGAEPHDVELSPAQVAQVEQAALVVLVRGLQPALDDAARGAGTFDALAAVGGTDPHVWLDPVAMTTVGSQLTAALGKLVPERAREIGKRWDTLVAELADVNRAAEEALGNCRSRDLVTGHAAFGRFAARYGLTETAITGVDDEAEPSPRRLGEVAALVRRNRVTTVFAESADSRPAQTVAREAGATVEVLDPIELRTTGDYLSVLRENVRKVARALGCT